jgi:hypothetical protein
MTPEDARKEIGRRARAVLTGEFSYLEAARKIFSLKHVADLDFDPDVIRFTAIYSNTDALPLGEVRKYWQPQALEKLQPEIERMEQWAQEYGRSACENLAARFGDPENSN